MALNLSSSLEDYLEAILAIRQKEGKVRITDISNELNVEKPSVNFAIKKLKNLNLVTHEPYEDIKLTEKGEGLARAVKEKHDTLTRFFFNFLGIPRDHAEKDACRMEHSISNRTFRRLSEFIDYLENHSCFQRDDWVTFSGGSHREEE
jgi:Mn-dependent DtxR family transcriptional regulator